MIEIVKAGENNTPLLAEIAVQTFIESHGHSAGKSDIEAYIQKNYTLAAVRNELSDPGNIYHIIYYNNEPAGYSKIVLTHPYEGGDENLTKLERLYLLGKFYNLKLGQELFRFNKQLSIDNKQSGIWLYVWKENQRAINFYLKNGFVINGSHDFRLSERHTNPNHRMILLFE
jgi:ribosomal protein S18 acetylase RimI-like enzyme